MDEPSKTSNIDKRTITKFQAKYHLVEDEDKQSDPIFDNTHEYGEWTTFTPLRIKLSSNENNNNHKNKNVIFTIDGLQDMMYKLYIQQELPSIKVKNKFRDTIRIRLIKNAAHHIFPTVRIFVSDINFGYDSVWADDYLQFMFENVYDRATYEERIGNRKYLREWSNVLPNDVISYPLLFNFSLEERHAFPIFLFKQKGKINHDIHFNIGLHNRILDIIEMEQLKEVNNEKHWKPIRPLAKYLQNVDKDDVLNSAPEMWTKYASINTRVKKWILDQCKSDQGKPGPYEIGTENIIVIDPKNTFNFGTSPEVLLQSDTPTQMITFKVQREECNKYNFYSNYTTSLIEDIGVDPISSDGIRYGISPRYPERSGKHSSRDGIWGEVPSIPSGVGYHAICNDNMRKPHRLGIVYRHIDNAKLVITLGQSFPYYPPDDNDINNEDSNSDSDSDDNMEIKHNGNSDNYHIKVRLLTWSTLKVDDNGEISYHNGDNDEKANISEKLFE